MGKPEEAASQSRWSRIPAKLKWSIIAITAAVVILALGLGLGLGLTLGGGGGGEDNGALPQPIPNTPTNLQIWQPKVGQSWQIVLLQPINLSPTATTVTPDVDIYDIDLFTNNQSTIDALHRMGKKVICYFSAGSYEPNRPDSDKFTEKDQGKGLEGWPGERWLKLDSANVRSIMSKRIDLAAQKKCDAIDPDNVDGFVSLQAHFKEDQVRQTNKKAGQQERLRFDQSRYSQFRLLPSNESSIPWPSNRAQKCSSSNPQRSTCDSSKHPYSILLKNSTLTMTNSSPSTNNASSIQTASPSPPSRMPPNPSSISNTRAK